MSVPEPMRHKGRMEVHVKALELAVHTAKILRNPKVFNPENDKVLIDRLVQKCKRGEISREKVDQSYQCWRECASKGDGYKMLQNMDKYYHGLWEDNDAENYQKAVPSGRRGSNQ